MPVKCYFSIVVLLLTINRLTAQRPSCYHYTTADGLASSTVYNIIQDKKGLVWFATLNGISKFDGKHFTTFRTVDGLNSNSIISLAEGINGELFIGNYEKGINILKNGKIANYCSEIDGRSFALSYLLPASASKGEQKLYAYRSQGGINSIIETSQGRLITHSINPSPVQINRLARLKNDEILALTPTGLYNFHNTRLTKKRITGFPDCSVFCLANGRDGSYFIGTRGMIYRIRNEKVIGKYKISVAGNNDVCAILPDKNNNIWFSVMNSGFYFIRANATDIAEIGSKLGLQGTLVNNFLEDNEGNIWVSTFGKGVFCLNHLYLKSYSENDGLSSNSVYSIVMERSGKLLIGTFNGLNILDNGKLNHLGSHSNKTLTEYIYNIKTTGNEFYISGAFGDAGAEEIDYKGIKLHLFDRPAFCKTSGGLYLSGGSGNYILVQRTLKYDSAEASMLFLFNGKPATNRVNDIYEDRRKNIWVGTGQGLCRITNPTGPSREWKKSFFPAGPVLNERINCIMQDNRLTIWFAGEKGVASYDLRNDSVKNYTKLEGYDLTSSTSVATDKKNRIWIGNIKGLYLFDGTMVRFLNRQTGLPSDEVLSLCSDSINNLLYVGTSNGFSILDISQYDNYHPASPEAKIMSIKAGDSLYTRFNNLVFESGQHDVFIDIKALYFSSPGSVQYQYKFNDDWVGTEYDFLNFLAMKPGTYTLQVRARAQNTGWGSASSVSFRILPTFRETIWFDLLLISLILLIAVFLVIWRLRINNLRIRRELELTERFNELKHQALSAMMNPHFISNSLNSVQYLVNSGRYEEANDYIAMIAKLMRKNLDTAGSGFILLSEEISRLKLYLDLEKLRFQESFSYEIITGADIDTTSIQIPNMIIQPFVENSLWHGIIHSGNRGLLTVSFAFEEVDIDSLTGKSLIIKVTDNGIGIKEARKNRKEDHNSKGIAIIEERLWLLSTRMNLPHPIMFEDLGSEDSDSQGTEVIISLPPPLYKTTFPGQGTPPNPAGKTE